MKPIIVLLCLAATMGLSCCSSGKPPAKPAETKDSTQQQLIANSLAPPDSDYTGDYFQKYENGVIKVRGSFRFGKKHGKWMYFRENGLLWSEAFFENEERHGESNVYHENGKLFYGGIYNHGKPTGTWRFYDTSAVLSKTINYDSIPQKK